MTQEKDKILHNRLPVDRKKTIIIKLILHGKEEAKAVAQEQVTEDIRDWTEDHLRMTGKPEAVTDILKLYYALMTTKNVKHAAAEWDPDFKPPKKTLKQIMKPVLLPDPS